MINVDNLRKSYDAWRLFVGLPDMAVSMKRIERFDNKTVILLSEIRLTQEPQRVSAIDITSIADEIALFAGAWPDVAQARVYAVVIEPDEGHTSVLLENGSEVWVSISETIIHLGPGTHADMEALVERMDDELQAHVDGGGSLGL